MSVPNTSSLCSKSSLGYHSYCSHFSQQNISIMFQDDQDFLMTLCCLGDMIGDNCGPVIFTAILMTEVDIRPLLHSRAYHNHLLRNWANIPSLIQFHFGICRLNT